MLDPGSLAKQPGLASSQSEPARNIFGSDLLMLVSEMSPDIMLEDIEMTEGPFHGDLPWCHMALYLSHGYKCDKCPGVT
jgi:hypothetical protein